MSKHVILSAFFISFLGFSSSVVFAETDKKTNGKQSKQKIEINNDGQKCPAGLVPNEKGWWWGCVEPEKKKIEKPLKVSPFGPTPEQKKKLCQDPKTWDAEMCGFVNPNLVKDYKKAFELQKKEQEELSKRMAMNPKDEKVVMDYQKYNKWWLGQSVLASRTWKFNLVQNPEMDYRSKNPISSYGLKMAATLQKLDQKNIFNLLKEEGGYLVWFTKSDCEYCHNQYKTFPRLKKRMEGMDIYNVSLDDKCEKGFEGKFCKTIDETVKAAAARLRVNIVPTLFMYIPNDKNVNELGGTWIRIATGLTDDTTIVNRSYSFFKAHASAIRKGLASTLKGQPAVDFSDIKPSGVSDVRGIWNQGETNEKDSKK